MMPSRLRIKYYGWRKDNPDFRDHPSLHPSDRLLSVPQQKDLRSDCSPIENQKALGACTGNAIVGMAEFLMIVQGLSLVNLSRLMLYYDERAIEGTVDTDAGAMIRDGMKSMHQTGVCSEKLWPYSIKRFADKPPVKCYAPQNVYKLPGYKRITTLNSMLNCLGSGFPFVFGFAVYENFEEESWWKKGFMPMPQGGMLGGHAVLAVGYDMTTRFILVRNSWGKSFGIGGYFWMPFDYITSHDLANDMWESTSIVAPKKAA